MSSSSRRRRKEGVRWIQHYKNGQKILLVGEGDFSFSACLATAFRSAVNMVATSLHSQELLKVEHWTSEAELQTLERLGCLILHEVDVYGMGYHPTLSRMKFDVVIFNFPHAGHFYGFCERDEELSDACYNSLIRGFPNSAHNKRGGDINCNKPFLPKLCFTFKFTLKKSYLPKNNVIDHNDQMVKKIDIVSGDKVKCIVKSSMSMNDVVDDHDKMVRKIDIVSGDRVKCIVKKYLAMNAVIDDHDKMVRKNDIVSGDRVKCIVKSSILMNDVIDDHDKMVRKIDTVSGDRVECIVKSSLLMNDVVDNHDKTVRKIDTVSSEKVKCIVKSSMPINDVDDHDKMVRKIDIVSGDKVECIVKSSMRMNDVVDDDDKIDTVSGP
ncbi:unnamed protein product [Camellia sinensis]